jgi:2-C-methyl-D-erythritol 4-phosphate cytidylyltransferase
MSSKINIAVIVAGGVGSRFGGEIPKQFIKINGKQIIEYSVETFSKIEEIAFVIVCCGEGYVDYAKDLFKESKKVKVIQGGGTRFHTCLNAIEFIRRMGFANSNVLIHDSARPLISKDIITNCIQKLKENSAVVVAIPAVETTSIVENGFVKSIPRRETVFIHQTPQCFDFHEIEKAYLGAKGDIKFTDDCGVYLAIGGKINVVEGDFSNKKITNVSDLQIVAKFLEEN